MNQKRRTGIAMVALVIAFALSLGGNPVLGRINLQAVAETVAVEERATVVASPFTQAVQDVKDSVVGVNNYGRGMRNSNSFSFGFGNAPNREREDREVLRGSGSGVVIAQGFVLTNYHVVEDATSLEVTAGEKTCAATLVGYDENLDIAVLKAEDLEAEPVFLGDSDLLNVGDWAICIGNPLSFSGTTTVGIISALNREIRSSSTDIYGRRSSIINNMIQTDAAINAGNSGGGMFNVAGELVGIPSIKFTGSFYSAATVEGIGMALPINAAKPLINDVLSGQAMNSAAQPGDITEDRPAAANRPRIGVKVMDMSSFSYYAVSVGILPRGVYIDNVESGSPAERAGLIEGDIVVEIDGNVITSSSQMVSILQAKEAGQTVAVKIYRVEGLSGIQGLQDIPDGEYMDLTVELAILD